jgi:hypothetical protein
MTPQKKTHLHQDLLKVLVKAKPSLRKAILSEADKALVYTICEICDNTLFGNVPLTPAQKTKIKKHKHIIRKLAQRGEGWQKKKKVLVQHGGAAFIPILLSVLSSVLPAIFGS